MDDHTTPDGKALKWDAELGGYAQHIATQQLIETTGMTREEHDRANAVHKANAKVQKDDEGKADEPLPTHKPRQGKGKNHVKASDRVAASEPAIVATQPVAVEPVVRSDTAPGA